MRNTGLEEAQAEIKIAGRDINNLRYADDTTVMAESEEELKNLLMKVKSESHSVVSDSLCLHGLPSPWKSPDQNTGVGSFSLLQGDLPSPGIEPRSPTLQADSLSAEPQGKPKNIGEGSLFGLQRIFLTQESNQGLLHCRQITN